MSVNRKIGEALALLAVIFIALYFFFPKDEEKQQGTIRVGAGSDITGVLLDAIVAEAEKENRDDSIVTSYVFVDCCSNTAQWALQAEEIDLGFYCSAAAMSMVNKVEGFELYAPIIMNSEVIAVLPETEELQTLGIPRKRPFLGTMGEEMYTGIEESREIDRTYLLYSLKLEEIDGAVIDVADAASAQQEGFSFLPLTDQAYISYCMVVRTSVAESEAFQSFLRYYERAVERLNTTEERVRLMKMDETFWEMSSLKFLSVTE